MKIIFTYVYSLAICSKFAFGFVKIPGIPLNLGQISYILLFISCFIVNRKVCGDKFLGMYALFILFYFLSSIITGFEHVFFDVFKLQLFVLFPLYLGTKILISQYKTIKPLLIPLIFIGVLSSIVTISQIYHSHFFDSLLQFMHVYDGERMAMMERHDSTIGQSMNGIYSSPVLNGHYLLFIFCMSLALIRERITLVRLVPISILFVGIFYCQQRSAFLFAVMAVVIFLLVLMKNKIIKTSHVIFICTLILLLMGNTMMVDDFSESRLSEINLSDRSQLFEDGIMYVSNNLLLGGLHQFTHIYGMPPHNTIISAFMAGGIIGGAVLIYMMFAQMNYAYKKCKRHKNILQYVFMITFFALIGDSMFHNTGYVQGDEATFIVWALILMSYNFKRDENNICK